VVPCQNKKPEQPPSVNRPKSILFLALLHHKIILAKPRPWARGNFRLLPAGDCLLLPGITVDECSDWLQHCFMSINAKIL